MIIINFATWFVDAPNALDDIKSSKNPENILLLVLYASILLHPVEFSLINPIRGCDIFN